MDGLQGVPQETADVLQVGEKVLDKDQIPIHSNSQRISGGSAHWLGSSRTRHHCCAFVTILHISFSFFLQPLRATAFLVIVVKLLYVNAGHALLASHPCSRSRVLSTKGTRVGHDTPEVLENASLNHNQYNYSILE